jgi:uncharacterized phage-associated protein
MTTLENIENFFLNKDTMTPLKLTKLCYLSYCWFLTLSKGEKICNEKPLAFRYGPAFKSTYDKYKYFGNEPMNIKLKYTLPKNVEQLLEKVWEIYGDYSPLQLSTLCHEKNSPWEKVWKNVKQVKGDTVEEILHLIEIPDFLIVDYYNKKIDQQKVSQ